MTRPDPVPLELEKWVAQQQGYLNKLLLQHPKLYVAERKRLTDEYEAKVRELHNG